MTELVQKTKFKIQLEMTTPRLLKLRKMFLLLTSLLVITAAVDIYIAGSLTLGIMMELMLAVMLFSFSNKCESLLLKQKIDDILSEKVVAQKDTE